MSSYVHFFARKKDTFIELDCYCRSNVVYRVIDNYAPFDKIREIDSDLLHIIMEDISTDMRDVEKSLSQYYENKKLVAQFNNSVEEKVEYLEDLDNMINELQYDLDELRYAKNFYVVLNNMLDNTKYNDEQTRFYVGIECGSDVDVSYIE